MKFKSTSSNEIGIQFKVWCPAFNRVTHRLFLLGSLPELGAWNIDDALEAYSTTDLHIWKVEAAIPPMSRFEWVWLKTSHDRSTMEWERQVKRNMEVDCFSGTLHTIWGDNQEVFLQSATCVELTTFMRVDEGYTMVLTGSTVTTGLWDIAQAVSAHEFPKRSGYWKAQVAFDAFSHLDFKWAVVKEKDSSHVRVKEKLSHSIYGRRAWIRAVAPWMMPMVVVVDTPALSDFSDNMLGRSDVIVNERKRRLEEIKTWLTESGKLPVPPRPSSTLTLATKPAEPEKVVVKSSSLTPSSLSLSSNLQSATRKPSVQRSQNLQDLQKSKPGLSRTERLTKQLNKDFKDEVYVLKGVGSIRTPTDLLNAGEQNFVPTISEGESKAFGDLNVLSRYAEKIMGSPVTERAHTPRLKKGSCKKPSTSMKQASPKGDSLQHPTSNPLERKSRKDNSKSKANSRNSSTERPLEYQIQLFDDFIRRVIHENNLESAESDTNTICSKPASIVKEVQSDTGFTEMSSTMSNPTTETLKSEVVAVKTEIKCPSTATLLPDPTNDTVVISASDVDEGYSEADIPLPVPKLEKLEFGMQTYWEAHQPDLEPSWLGDTRDELFSSYTKHSKFQAEDLAIRDEDGKHLDWMTSRVAMEDEYCTTTLGLGFEMPPDHPFIGNVVFMSGGTKKMKQDLPLQCSLINLESVDTEGFNLPGENVCSHNDTHNQDTADHNKGSSSKSKLLEIEGSGLASQLRGCDENGDINERRQIARSLEFQWGASSGGGIQPKEDMVTPIELLCDDPVETINSSPPSHPYSMNGDGQLASCRYEKYEITRYSCSEFSNAFRNTTKTVDRRARAHEIEKEWGEKQRTLGSTKKTRDTLLKSPASMACGDTTKSRKRSSPKKIF